MMVRELPGRPCKLTSELAARIVESIRKGAFLNAAAGSNGVHRLTVRDWIVRGTADAEAGLETDFSVFATAVSRAQSEHEAELAATFTRGGDGKYPDWRAQAFLVERRYEHWRLPKEQASVGISLTLSNEQVAALVDALRVADATDITPQQVVVTKENVDE
jgi:hypothetical protein